MECVTKALLSHKECEVGSLSKVYPDSIIESIRAPVATSLLNANNNHNVFMG